MLGEDTVLKKSHNPNFIPVFNNTTSLGNTTDCSDDIGTSPMVLVLSPLTSEFIILLFLHSLLKKKSEFII